MHSLKAQRATYAIRFSSPFTIQENCCVCITYLTQIRNSFFAFAFAFFNSFHFLLFSSIRIYVEQTNLPKKNCWFKRKAINRNRTHRKSMKHVKFENFFVWLVVVFFRNKATKKNRFKYKYYCTNTHLVLLGFEYRRCLCHCMMKLTTWYFFKMIYSFTIELDLLFIFYRLIIIWWIIKVWNSL